MQIFSCNMYNERGAMAVWFEQLGYGAESRCKV